MFDKLTQGVDMVRHEHFKIKICVSGAADMGHLPPDTFESAKVLGEAIAKQGCTLTTGATTGFPFWAAQGAKRVRGISVGFSPASSEREHVQAYKLPIDFMDVIVYTGFGYPGRDLFLTRASDAVIIGPGRVGTFHEFSVAYEDNKPIGILESDLWETDDILHTILDKSHRSTQNIFFDKDPVSLVSKVITSVKQIKINDTHTSRA